MIKFSVQQIVAIFMFFLFGSVIFGILLRKINQIESDNRVVFRKRPEFIFYDDMPYRYPRRSIDVNFRGINVPTPPTTAPTTAEDTSSDEALARALQEEYDRERQEVPDGGSGGSDGDDDWQPFYRRQRGFSPDGAIVDIEPYTNFPSSLMGSPLFK